MANIAQMINVIQAVILTEQDKMILTPTYHVFEMYKVHQDAEKVALDIEVDTVDENGQTFPHVSASASKSKDGTLHISLCNLDKIKSAELNIDLRGMNATDISGRILTSNEMNAMNTFENPNHVVPEDFTGFTEEDNILNIELPSKSVVVLAIK